MVFHSALLGLQCQNLKAPEPDEHLHIQKALANFCLLGMCGKTHCKLKITYHFTPSWMEINHFLLAWRCFDNSLSFRIH